MITFSPSARILLYIFFVISVFLSNSFKVDLGLLVLVLLFARTVPLSVFSRGLIPITLFLIFTFFSNIFFQTGKIIYEFKGILVTEDALKRGMHLTLRLFLLIVGAKILTATTSAEDLVKAVTVMLGPVGKWRPVREFIFTMSLTLRFLPIIYSEAQNLYKENSQNSPSDTFADKIKLSVSLLAPLFERSLRKARELSKEGKA